MDSGTSFPLYVAGVAGGVGTSAWIRGLRSCVRVHVEDLGVYRGGRLDVLITSNTAASTARLGEALGMCKRPPVLIVMHTVPGSVGASRAHLRRAAPHITRIFRVRHQHDWSEIDNPPGPHLPKGFIDVVRAIPSALHEMYTRSPQPVAHPQAIDSQRRFGASVGLSVGHPASRDTHAGTRRPGHGPYAHHSRGR